MMSKKRGGPPPIPPTWSLETFSAGVLKLVKARFTDSAPGVEEQDVRRWIEQRWPVPVEAALNTAEWARAFVDERQSAGAEAQRVPVSQESSEDKGEKK
jgi:hypothetical protein